MVGVTQLGLLLHGSMSKFQSFLPSDLAITSRAFSKYTIESYQLSTEKSSKLYIHVFKHIRWISIEIMRKKIHINKHETLDKKEWRDQRNFFIIKELWYK